MSLSFKEIFRKIIEIMCENTSIIATDRAPGCGLAIGG